MTTQTTPKIDLAQRAETIQWCSDNNMVPLPVAPRQDAKKYPVVKRSKAGDYCPLDIEGKYGDPYDPIPLFTGKNPSFIDGADNPKLIAHTKWRDKQPEQFTLDLWFNHPSTGVGVLAGVGGVDWIDLDRKNFNTQEDCDNAAARILEHCDRTYYERTRSGGCHIAIKLEQAKDFTNYALEKGGEHVGEFLGHGRFCVLAPTPGYEALNGREIATIDKAESLGIYPVRSEPTPPTVDGDKTIPQYSQQWAGKSVELCRLITKKNNSVLKGQPPTDADASKLITGFARDAYGWSNFCNVRNVALAGVDSAIQQAADVLGIDNDRLGRCLEKVNASTCKPALEKTKGVEACESRLNWAINPPKVSDHISSDDIELDDEDTAGLVAYRHLYEHKDCITIGDDIYEYQGTHYELVNPGKRRHEIALLLKRCVKTDVSEQGVKVTRPYATGRQVACAMNFSAALMPAIAPDEVGVAGINCTNGVLQLSWLGGRLISKLVPHDPSMIFLSSPKVTYDPDADDQHYQALMQAVEPEFQSIVLRTLASSLDLAEVKRRQHRPVRIAAFLGGGSNGKDAFKVAMSAILSNRGLTSVPLSAFQQYDQGRQFGLAALAGSRLNWPSENAFTSTLDSLECIKSVVTGEPLQYERKNKDAVEFTPCSTLIFNGNAETLKLLAGNEAVRSRYAVIPFSKTFKRSPDPADPDELQADPRFKNEQWVAENLAPAMLNILLKQLEALANEGIDYSPIDAVMDEHSMASFHLAEFINDVGLVPAKGKRVPIAEIWTKLLNWYENEGLITRDDYGKIGFDVDPRPGDKLVRNKKQLSPMLIKFIGGATNKGPGAKSNGMRYLVNVAWASDLEEQQDSEETPQTESQPVAEQVSQDPIDQPIDNTEFISLDEESAPESESLPQEQQDSAVAVVIATVQSTLEYYEVRKEYRCSHPSDDDWNRAWAKVPLEDQQRIQKLFEKNQN